MPISTLAVAALALSLGACLVPPAARVPAADVRQGEANASTQVDKETMVFLLIGQSNMVGKPVAEPEDEVEDARVRVLAYEDCPRLGRVYDHWYTAKPPLHICYGGLGPGDYFGKALAAAYPNATIALVPLAIPGVDIDFFVKGAVSKRRKEFRIPPDDHWSGAYDWVIERARLAQRSGTLRGIIFHQGESDTGSEEWIEKVKTMVANLRADLGAGDLPFVAGELLREGCCGQWHNPLVKRLAKVIGNSRVVSSQGLSGLDVAHFDLRSQRELGKRYAAAMIELLGPAPKQ